jgi:pyruvate kinase
MKATKIIATIGPASDSIDILRKLHEEGMNIARLNFSHGDYEYFAEIIKRIREVSDEIAILLDTKGPEIRTGDAENNSIILKEGQELTFTNHHIIGNREKITIHYDFLHKIEPGHKLLIDDGLIEAEVLESDNNHVKVIIKNGGELGSKKTVSFQGHNVEVPFFSEKDKEDILFGIKYNVDFIAASFVRKGKDIQLLQEFLKENNAGHIMLISKIEHWEAVQNIDDIIERSDGIMVARGDLGVEVPLEKVPKIQSNIIRWCNEHGKPVIVATQMLESMRNNPRPTRAEVNDVAQAILQGTDAIMLSGETASGKYPEKAVHIMRRIAQEYDTQVETRLAEHHSKKDETHQNATSLFMTRAAYLSSKILKTKAILTPTESGATARNVSRFKPKCPILAITQNKHVFRQLQISWGVIPLLETKKHCNLISCLKESAIEAFQKGFFKEDDKIVITGGKYHTPGSTNTLEIYQVKDLLE